MKKWDNALFETLENNRKKVNTDKQFLKKLSAWIVEYTGNVNVTQRLSALSNRLRK